MHMTYTHSHMCTPHAECVCHMNRNDCLVCVCHVRSHGTRVNDSYGTHTHVAYLILRWDSHVTHVGIHNWDSYVPLRQSCHLRRNTQMRQLCTTETVMSHTCDRHVDSDEWVMSRRNTLSHCHTLATVMLIVISESCHIEIHTSDSHIWVAKTHRMPYLYRSFSSTEPYN